jgi:hypothetical protein
MRDRACHGERTLTDGDFEECLECEMRVRWDLTSDALFGFHSCPQAPKRTLDIAIERGADRLPSRLLIGVQKPETK